MRPDRPVVPSRHRGL